MYVATGLGHNVIIMKLVTFFNRLVESADLLPPVEIGGFFSAV